MIKFRDIRRNIKSFDENTVSRMTRMIHSGEIYPALVGKQGWPLRYEISQVLAIHILGKYRIRCTRCATKSDAAYFLANCYRYIDSDTPPFLKFVVDSVKRKIFFFHYIVKILLYLVFITHLLNNVLRLIDTNTKYKLT